MGVPVRPLDRPEHGTFPDSIESVLSASLPMGLKPAAQIRMDRTDAVPALSSSLSSLYSSAQPSPHNVPGPDMKRDGSRDSIQHSISWQGEVMQPRTSSPELDTDISRTSSTSTKESKNSALEASVKQTFAEGLKPSAEDDGDADKSPEEPSRALPPAQCDEAATRVRQKRLHALLELLETERNYARDLSVLNNVYFKMLRNVPYFTEVPSRYPMVVRNGPALLALHTSLHTRLSSIITSLRLHAGSGRSELERACSDEVDEATKAFGQSFVDMAPQFQVYQDFCTKHKESLALIDMVEGRSEWDQFQQRAFEAVQQYDEPALALPAADQEEAAPSTTHKRLYFRDYFIKPIQRICLYPIILQNVVKLTPDHGRAELEAAVVRMQQVVAEVDAASARRASLLLSELFVSRMEPSAAFAPTFVPSLGDIKMAGNLDVLYHHPTKAPLTTPLAIKYYGCVLYADYFLILKVRKSQTYAPRFWFPMAEAKVTHADSRALALPQSLRISVRGHHFEMIASTPKELELWTHALHDVMEQGPARTRRVHDADVAFPCNLEACPPPADAAASDSQNELDPLSLYLSTQSLAEAESGRGRLTHSHSEILLRQKSPPRRAAKDRSMIFSDACISARTSIDTEGARSLVGSRLRLHRLSGSEYVSLRIPTTEVKANMRSVPESLCSSPVFPPSTLEADGPRPRTAPSRRSSMDAALKSGSLSRRNSAALLVPLRAALGSPGSETPRRTSSPENGTPQRSPSMTSLTRHALGRKVSGWLTQQRPAPSEEAEGTASDVPLPPLSTSQPAAHLARSSSSTSLRPRPARSSLDQEAADSSEVLSPTSSVPRRFAKRFLQLNQFSPMG